MANSLTYRAVHAAKWSYVGNVVKALLQFAAGIVLARLIGPEGFGVVAIAWIMIGFGTLFADAGLSSALVQAPNLTQNDINFAATIQVAIGALLALGGVAAAYPMAAFFEQPKAVPILQVISALFLIRSLGQTQAALLRRRLDYKRLQYISVSSYFVGYVLVGIPAGHYGLGAWALVIAQLIQTSIECIAVNLVSKQPIRFQITPGPARIGRFGAWIIGTNIVNWILSNLDTIFVGSSFGSTALGLYNRSLALVSTPTTMSVSAAQSVLMATVSRVDGDGVKARRAYLVANQLILSALAPVLLAVAVVPETIALGVYGKAWIEAASLIPPLALAMLAHGVLALIGPILNARGRTNYEFYSQSAALILFATLLYHAKTISIEAIAWCVVLTNVFRTMTLLFCLSKEINGVLLGVLIAVKYPLAISFGVALTALIVDGVFHTDDMTVKLLVVVGVSGLSYVGIAFILAPRIVSGDGARAIAQSFALPRVVRRWLDL